jgi:hypothetical protein
VSAERVRAAVLSLADRAPTLLDYDDWLYFRSRDGQRRLADYPESWADLPADELERLLGRARLTRP